MCNIYNGLILPNELAHKLLNARSIDINEVKKIISERLKPDNKQRFWEKTSKNEFPNFVSNNKVVSISTAYKIKSIKVDKELFHRFLVVSKSRNIVIEQLN